MKNKICVKQSEIEKYWQSIVEFMRHYADTVLFRILLPISIVSENKLKSKYPSLKNCIKRNLANNTDGRDLYFDFDDDTFLWLLTQEPFNPQIDGIKKNDASDISISFCQGEEELLWISQCYCTVVSYDREFNNKFNNQIYSLRKNSVPQIYKFIDKFYAYELKKEIEPIDLYYADIDTKALTAIFDCKLKGEYDIFDFYEDNNVMQTIAKLLVNRAKTGKIHTSLLYQWFMMHTMFSRKAIKQKEKEIVGADIIYEYLSSLPLKEFLDSFPYHCDKFNLYYLDKISMLWNERNIDAEKYGDADIMKVIELWCSENINILNTKKNIFSMYFNFANKYPTREERLKAVYAIRRKKLRRYFEELNGRAERIYLYFYGIFVSQDLNKAFRLLSVASKENNCDCQYDLARCYLNGWGTVKDIEQAKYWFGKAAENGHPKAQAQLALINNKG